ncbi:MAG: alginate export family protein [Planctomycetes bacterium]|nr:alginate export family protein [Planctomycetota bacterium]
MGKLRTGGAPTLPVLALTLLATVLPARVASAQSNEELLRRMEALEKRVQELEAEKAARDAADRAQAARENPATPPAPATTPASTPTPRPTPTPTPAPAADAGGGATSIYGSTGPAPGPATPPAPGKDRSWWEKLKVGGQVRVRGEWKNTIDYRTPGTLGRPATDRPNDDDDVALLRTRLWVDATPVENVRAYVQIQDSRIFGEEASVNTDSKNVDLHQGFFELQRVLGSRLTARIGRQEFLFGDQRLVSPNEFSNVGRSFDAVRLTWNAETWSADLFTSLVREGTTTDEDRNFDGLYLTYKGLPDHTFDLYLFQRRFSDGTIAGETGPPGDLIDFTPGVRAKGKTGAVDYGAELAWQVGERGNDDVSAHAVACTVGYTFEMAGKPRLGVLYEYASGDAHPTDGRFGTFDSLFPFKFAYQGWRNGHDAVASLEASPFAGAKFTLEYHNYWLEHQRDAWYLGSGAALRRAATGSPSTYVGSELVLVSKIVLNPSLDLVPGYAHMFAGDFLRDTGFAEDTDWLFLQARVNF